MYVPPNLSVLSFPFTLATLADLHQTGARCAITNLEMPAMSPTMTEGGIASWKTKEGASFSAGEVLLEIVGARCSFSVGRDFTVELMYPRQETDKATIDVEAQEDGILGKILVRLCCFTAARHARPCTHAHTHNSNYSGSRWYQKRPRRQSHRAPRRRRRRHIQPGSARTSSSFQTRLLSCFLSLPTPTVPNGLNAPTYPAIRWTPTPSDAFQALAALCYSSAQRRWYH